MSLNGEPEIILPSEPATSQPPTLPLAKRQELTPTMQLLYQALNVPAADWGLPSGRVIAFAHGLIVPHGKFVGKPLRLRQFQIDFVRDVYNPVGEDGRRLRRTAILSIGRRGGKTLLASVLLLCHIVGPMKKLHSTLASAATTRKQASIVFRFASVMIRHNPALVRRLKIVPSTKTIVNIADESTYSAVSADAGGSFGEGLDLVIFDELSQSKNTDLYDALVTSLGSQTEPLFMAISTQAATDVHLLSELIDYGLRIKRGELQDDTFAVHLYAADLDCNLLDESQWRKANPTIGDYRDLDEFRASMKRAVQVPSLEAKLRNLYLNQRVQAKAPFLTATVWKRGEAPPLDEALLHGSNLVYGGLDLGESHDLCAFVMAVDTDDGGVALYPRIYTPADTLVERAIRDRAPYQAWAKQGLLIPVPGSHIDYDWVAADIGELSKTISFGDIAFDMWRIEHFRAACNRAGLPLNLKKFGQGYRDMSPAVECFEGLALDGKLHHGGHPVLKWCVSNAVIERDPAGNRKLNKARSFGRIDVAVAGLMAVAALKLQTAVPFDPSAAIG